MRVNLKTFPTEYQDYLGLGDWLYDVMKWKSDFEAELLKDFRYKRSLGIKFPTINIMELLGEDDLTFIKKEMLCE